MMFVIFVNVCLIGDSVIGCFLVRVVVGVVVGCVGGFVWVVLGNSVFLGLLYSLDEVEESLENNGDLCAMRFRNRVVVVGDVM
jgi:hypothetical protein